MIRYVALRGGERSLPYICTHARAPESLPLEAKVQIQKAAVAIVSVAVLAMYGCTCTSDGLELDASGDDGRADILIEWHDVDAFAGTMTATVANGIAYLGPYLLITPDARADQLAPLREGWNGKGGWQSWSQEPAKDFLETYDGMVIANLGTENGGRMRCRFQLDFPSLGMSGGGSGKCQFFGGKTVAAEFSAGRAD